jgi:hypothetical protein
MNSRKKEGQSHKRGINATKLITVGGMPAYRMSIMGQETGTVEEIAGFPAVFGRDDLPRIVACFGSEADMVSRLRHVRSSPQSRHSSERVARPLCARSGHQSSPAIRLNAHLSADLDHTVSRQMKIAARIIGVSRK